MSGNKYQGTVEITLDEKKYTLRFDYEALSEVFSKYGRAILNNLFDESPDTLADILAIGLKADKVSKEEVLKVSPPIFETAGMINKAISYAYFGPKGKPVVAADADAAKKNEDPTKTK